jgi:Tfp pilus assembly protein PilX
MKSQHQGKFLSGETLLRNQNGFLLVAALSLLAILTLLGTTAYLLSSTDIKIGNNFKINQQVLEVAMAGAERGREVLRQTNMASADATAFNSELVLAAGTNGVFDLSTAGSDDVPLVGATQLGSYVYTVYLSNDAVDINPPISAPTADSNNKVLITSVATGPNNARAVVEVAVSLPAVPAPPPPPAVPPPPGTITLLGNSHSFLGGNSNAKALNGDDQCGNAPPLPVVSVSNGGSLGNVQSSISSSKPATYHTKVDGQSVTAETHVDDIAKAITSAELDSIESSSGIDLRSAADLNDMVSSIRAVADTALAGDGNSNSVNLGSVNNLQTVVIDGDFTMNEGSSGAGILVVKGNLTFAGNINYTGVIMVIGKGSMTRSGGGSGTISGAIWVANTVGADGIIGTADDSLGLSQLDTSGGGNSNIQHCSSAINNALGNLDSPPAPPPNAPLTARTFRQLL